MRMLFFWMFLLVAKPFVTLAEDCDIGFLLGAIKQSFPFEFESVRKDTFFHAKNKDKKGSSFSIVQTKFQGRRLDDCSACLKSDGTRRRLDDCRCGAIILVGYFTGFLGLKGLLAVMANKEEGTLSFVNADGDVVLQVEVDFSQVNIKAEESLNNMMEGLEEGEWIEGC